MTDVVREVLVVSVLLGGGDEPPDQSLTVTTLRAGKLTFTVEPEIVTEVDAKV